MMTFRILCLSLPILSLASGSKNYGEPEDVLLSGWHIDGQVVSSVSSNGPKECLQRCNENPHCVFGEFHVGNSSCQLKQNGTNVSRNVQSMLVASSYKEFTRIPKYNLRKRNKTDSKDDGDIANGIYHHVGNEEVCRKLCAIHPLCNIALFLNDQFDVDYKNTCLLRQATAIYYTAGDTWLSFLA